MRKPNSHNRLIAFLLLLCIYMPGYLSSQVRLDVMADAGENNASEKPYFRSSAMACYRIDGMSFKFGGIYNITENFSSNMYGLYLGYLWHVQIKEHPFNVGVFYLYNSFSESIQEHNLGMITETHSQHFEYRLGIGFRTYELKRRAKEKFNIEAPGKVSENFYLLYALKYFIKPIDNVWNAGLYGGNIDLFRINQATNPFFGIFFRYQVTEPLQVFGEFYYMSAGAFNLSVNPFGYNFRAGIKWKIKD